MLAFALPAKLLLLSLVFGIPFAIASIVLAISMVVAEVDDDDELRKTTKALRKRTFVPTAAFVALFVLAVLIW